MKYIRMNKYSKFIIDNLISVIDLKNALIDTFPELPDNIVEIYLDNNDIPKISCQLPCNLRILSVCSNLITELLYIPPTLKELYISNNKNIVLLPKITTDLKVFQCTDCKLRRLPELPDTLISLNVSNNKLTAIDIPINIEILNIVNNRISRLHFTQRHSSLTELRCDNNVITHINYIPDSISEFHCSYNNLRTFPNIPLKNLVYNLQIVKNSIQYPYNLKIAFSYWNNPLVYDFTDILDIGQYINKINSFRKMYYKHKLIQSLYKYIQYRRQYIEDEYTFLYNI